VRNRRRNWYPLADLPLPIRLVAPGLLPVCRQTGNDRMLLNLIAEGKRLSGAERSAQMEHLIHFAQKVTS
jgi:hypothetical protein